MSKNFDFEQLKQKYLSEMNGMIAKKNHEQQNKIADDASSAANSAISNAPITEKIEKTDRPRGNDADISENSETLQQATGDYKKDDIFGNLKENLPEFDDESDKGSKSEKGSNNYGNDGNEPNMMPTAKGTLSIEVTSAGRAVPIEGAYIIISETVNGKEKLLYTLQSDRNGETRAVELATYPKELSNDPEFFGKPYKTYTVTAKKTGFFTVEDLQVPIFADLNSIQPINMIPISENYNGGQMIVNEETQILPIIKPNTNPNDVSAE